MNTSNSLLTPTGTIANEIHSAEIQTVSRHSGIHKASEESECSWGWRNGVVALATAFSYNIAQIDNLIQNYLDIPHPFGRVMD
jgi:hypothetical protein